MIVNQVSISPTVVDNPDNRTQVQCLPELRHTAIVERYEQAPFRNTLGRKLLEDAL